MELKNLKALQASLVVLAMKVKNFHWNVKGLEFFEIHSVTDEFYERVADFSDEVAEKLVMNDVNPVGTLQEALQLSKISEVVSQPVFYELVCGALVEDCQTILKLANESETSPTIQPLLDEIFLVFDKYHWQFKKTVEK
ncbi:Dps family protein [Candidatus Mycoplasma pogonae]